MAKLILSSLFLVLAYSSYTFAQSQRVILYEGTGSTGAFVSIGANYVPDLSAHSFNNRARSACVTGVWLFYDLINYNAAGNNAMEYVFGNNYCVNFVGLGGAVSSMRYAGPPTDYRLSSLTLFSGTYFQGQEEYTTLSLPNLSLQGRIASLLVTGSPTEGWTLYDRANYAGNAVCIYPPSSSDHEPAFIHDTTIISVPHNTIASVRKGCWGKVTVPVLSERQGYQLKSDIVE